MDEHEHVADGIEDLVLHELVVVAQAFAVQHLHVVDDDRVVHAAAEPEAARAHHLDVLGEAERASARDLALVVARAHVEHHALAGLVHRRVVELDLEAEPVAFVRLQARPLQRRARAFAQLDRLLHAQEALGRLLQLDAGALQQEHERRGRAVEDRHLFVGGVDEEIVDAQARARRQEMLDRLHRRAARIVLRRERGGKPRVGDGERIDLDLDRHRQVDPPEHDAGVGRRRPQRELHALPAVHPKAHRAGERLEGALGNHELILGGLNQPACAGTRGSRSRPSRCSPAHPPSPPPCVRCATRSAS